MKRREYVMAAQVLAEEKRAKAEKEKTEHLLFTLLPRPIAAKVIRQQKMFLQLWPKRPSYIAENVSSATVLSTFKMNINI